MPNLFQDLSSDLRGAVRRLRKETGFLLGALGTLALGIGALTATWSLADTVLLEPLPYPQPERLVFLWTGLGSDENADFSGPEAAELFAEASILRRATAIKGSVQVSFATDGEAPEDVVAQSVSVDHFRVYGVEPMIGRNFEPEDEFHLTPRQMQDPDLEWPLGAVLISHSFWQRRFGGDPGVVGKTVERAGHPAAIIGVLPPHFRDLLPAALSRPEIHDVYYLSPWDASRFPRNTRFVSVLARLPEGASLAEAQAEADAFAARRRQRFAEYRDGDYRLRVVPLHDEVVSRARGPVWTLVGASALMLIAVCVNLASLQLARMTRQLREAGLRAALGASRSRLVQGAMTESVLLALVGGLLGVGVAIAGIRLVEALGSGSLPRLDLTGLDVSVLVFSLTVTLCTAVLFGLVPALRLSRVDLSRCFAGGRSGTGGGRSVLNQGLIVAEVAIAVVLMVGGGLLLRSLVKLVRVDPGYDTSVLTAQIGDLDRRLEEKASAVRRFQEALRAHPAIDSAAFMYPVPVRGREDGPVARKRHRGEDLEIRASLRKITPGALETLGIRLLKGRGIEWRDVEHRDQLSILVDQRLADLAWPGEDPVGRTLEVRRLLWWENPPRDELAPATVIGVVENVRATNTGYDDPPSVYAGHNLNWGGAGQILLRGRGASRVSLVEAVREVLDETGYRGVTLSRVATIDDYVRNDQAPLRQALVLIWTFGLASVAVAVVGVVALVTYSVAQRRNEIGIRLALGAGPRRVVRGVLGSGLRPAVAGLLLGLTAGAGMSRLIASYLYGIERTDPVTYATLGAVFVTVVAVSIAGPAVRASRLDPAETLRE